MLYLVREKPRRCLKKAKEKKQAPNFGRKKNAFLCVCVCVCVCFFFGLFDII